MLSFYLNNELVDEPLELTQVTEHLYYSESLSSYILEVDGNVTFTGSEYAYLYDLFNNNVCASVDIRILSDDGEIDFNGLINVSDISFIPDRCEAICEIQNNNITAKIENNKSIDCVLNVGRSKNDVEYTPIITNVTLHNPTLTDSVVRRGMRVYDAFTSMMAFLTDGEIGFVSDYFDYNVSTNEQAFSVITNGSEVRNGTEFAPTISFNDLFNDLNSLENLALAYEDGNIRIEDKDYFKQQLSSVTFNDVKDLSQQLAIETLYARVTFGSAEVSTDYDYLQDIRFNCVNDESYHLGGQCNTDTELDISTKEIITDPNVIQRVLPSGSMGGQGDDSYDEKVMIISCDSNDESKMTLKPASSTDYYYNDRYLNINVAPRWFGQIPQSIYAFLGNGNDGCFINQDTDQTLTAGFEGFQPTQEAPLPFNDVNGNYSIESRWFPTSPVGDNDPDYTLFAQLWADVGVYTAPSNGVYTFEYEIFTNIFEPFFIQKMRDNSNANDASGNSYSPEIVEQIAPDYWRVYGGGTFYLNTGEYVGVLPINGSSGNNIIYTDSFFKCFDPLGGVWNVYDSSSVYNIENKADYPIRCDDWKAIKNAPFQSILMTYNSGSTSGWLKSISRSLDGNAEIVLLGRNNA
jgi:hypothetical protein